MYVPVLVYDCKHQAIGAIHSGWRGSQQNVVGATIDAMAEAFGTSASDIYVYVGAAASQCCYEVGPEVAQQFDKQFSRVSNAGKYWFDNKGVVLSQLLDKGVESTRIELDSRCTICDTTLHSYRRDGAGSGRMFAVIGMSV